MGDGSSPMFRWCECTATCAIVHSIAAHVAPNPTWSSPEPAWESAEPEESATTYDHEGDDVAEEKGAQDAPSTAADGDHAVSTAGASVHGHDVESGPPSRVRGTDLARNRAMNQEPSNEGSWESAVPCSCHVTRFYAQARGRRGGSSGR